MAWRGEKIRFWFPVVLLGIGLVAMIVSFVLALIHSDDKEDKTRS